jgi:hypothetical protein
MFILITFIFVYLTNNLNKSSLHNHKNKPKNKPTNKPTNQHHHKNPQPQPPPKPQPPQPPPQISSILQNIQQFLNTNYQQDDNYGKIFTGYIPKKDGYLPTPNFFGDIAVYNKNIINPTKIYPFYNKNLQDTNAMKGPLYYYNMIISAKKSVDWIGLWFFPDDIWLQSILQGISDLDKTNTNPILIRFFWGRYVRNPTETQDDLKQFLINITKYLKKNSKITIVVGQYCTGDANSISNLSWNHGKILNID